MNSNIVTTAVAMYNYQSIIISLVATKLGVHANIIVLILLFV